MNNFEDTGFKKLVAQGNLSVREKGVLEKNNSLEIIDGNAKVAVPRDILLRIDEDANKEHPLLNEIFETFSNGDVMIPRVFSGKDDSFYDETITTRNLEPLLLEGYELSKSVEISMLLASKLGDSAYDYIMHILTTRVADAKINAYVYGNGTTEPTGITTALKGTDNHVSYAGLTHAELLETTDLIAPKFASGAKIYANKKTIFTELASIVDGNGRPIFKQEVSEDIKGQALGFLVIEESGMKDGDILVGNINEGYHVNSQEELSLLIEEKGKERKRVINAVQITDGGVLAKEAFVFFSKAS